jgi:hypothetical protein
MAVNLSPVGGAAAQFFTNTGAVLTGGKLYTYAAGTTTPLATYTTSSGSVARTNPVVLDAAGRVPDGGEIWLAPNVSYKFVLKDSSDTLIATYDNITGINGTGVATNASNVQYDPAGTGAVATTVQAKLRETVSVKDFGAVGDGVTDDTTAIQEAVDYVSVNGGAVYFPAGSYLLNGTTGADGIKHGVHVPYTGPGITAASEAVVLYGDGARSRLIANSPNMIIIRWSSNNGAARDLMLLGDGTSIGLGLMSYNSTASTPSNAICWNNFTRLTIGYCQDGVRLQCPLGLDNGVYYNGFSDLYIYYAPTVAGAQGGRGVYFYTLTGATGDQNRNTFSNISFQRMNTGIEIQDGDTNTFYSCTFEDITKGTLPNATPTSIVIGAGVISSASNRFFGVTMEACTRHLENNNPYSEFYSCMIGYLSNKMLLNEQPMVFLGGYDGSNQPTIFPGWFRGEATSGISVVEKNIRDVDYFSDGQDINYRTQRLMRLGAIPANGNTKTFTFVFDGTLDTTAPLDVTVNARFHGWFSNWNASGQKLISTAFGVSDLKRTADVGDLTDTDVIATTGIGGAGVVTRTGLTFSTTQFTLTYTFNAANALTSPVEVDIEVIVGGNSGANAKPVKTITIS